jgi:hypothetical protein
MGKKRAKTKELKHKVQINSANILFRKRYPYFKKVIVGDFQPFYAGKTT